MALISSKSSKDENLDSENVPEDPIDEELNELIDSENFNDLSTVEEVCNDCGNEINQNLEDASVASEIEGQENKAEETPSTYDVKDEKICRKKREAERLSKTIKKNIKSKSAKVNEEQNADNENLQFESKNDSDMEVQEQEMEVEKVPMNKKNKREVKIQNEKNIKRTKKVQDKKNSKNQKSVKSLKNSKNAFKETSIKEEKNKASKKLKSQKSKGKKKNHKGKKTGHKKGKKSEL